MGELRGHFVRDTNCFVGEAFFAMVLVGLPALLIDGDILDVEIRREIL